MNGEGITNKLLSDLTHANGEAKRYRLQKKELMEELNQLKAEHAKVAKELETLRATPNQLQDELTRVRAELRTISHKGEFHKLAKELKVRDEAVDDLWSLSNYKAEGDQPNVDAMKTAITEAVKSRPYLLSTEQPAQNGYSPGPGLSRGGMNDGVGFSVRRSDAANPEWLRTNGQKMANALKDGSLRWAE